MKFTIPSTKEIEVAAVNIVLPVNYDEEDIPNDFPMRHGDRWTATVEIDTGKIRHWPQGQAARMFMKVRDEGIYTLLDPNNFGIRAIEGSYVPHGLIPGEYGDYVHFEINQEGVITNWPKRPNIDQFFED